jgi:uncharacterized protein YkwD
MEYMLIARSRTLLLLLLGTVLLVVPGIAQASVNCTPDASWGTLNTAFEAQVAVQLNQQRAANNLPPLAVSPLLTQSAEWKSLHMSEYQYFDHSDPAPPVARDAGTRISDCGYTFDTAIGENIAEGFPTVSAVVAAWMASDEHRANILESAFTVVGVGVARDASGQYWWTTDFGGFADPGTVAAGTSPVTTPPTTAAPVTTATPVAPAPVAPAPPATTATTTTTAKTTTTTKTAVPTPAGTTTVGASVGGMAGGPGTPAAASIGKAVTVADQLVAVHDRVGAKLGKARTLFPLKNDLDPETAPLHLVRILKQPPGSHARILPGGRTIRLRLSHRALPKKQLRLVYVVSTASGQEAKGVVRIVVVPS